MNAIAGTVISTGMDETTTQRIMRRVATLLRERRMKWVDLARLSRVRGMNGKRFSLWRDGTGAIDADHLMELSRILNVSVTWLLGLSDEPPTPERAGEEQMLINLLRAKRVSIDDALIAITDMLERRAAAGDPPPSPAERVGRVVAVNPTPDHPKPKPKGGKKKDRTA